MKFEMEVVLPNTGQLISEFGIENGGKVHQLIDTTFIYYMRLKMPKDSGVMIANTRETKVGEIQVQTPYAHYMNEGILYVMDNGKGAYYNPTYGFWSEPGKKKHPSDKKLNYHGGPGRGAHFVERTVAENTNDIIRTVQREMNRK